MCQVKLKKLILYLQFLSTSSPKSTISPYPYLKHVLWVKVHMTGNKHFHLTLPISLYAFEELLDCVVDLLDVACLFTPKQYQPHHSSASVHTVRELVKVTTKLLDTLTGTELVTLPFNILTFGLFTFIVNAWTIMLADYFVSGVTMGGFLNSLLAAFIIAIFQHMLRDANK